MRAKPCPKRAAEKQHWGLLLHRTQSNISLSSPRVTQSRVILMGMYLTKSWSLIILNNKYLQALGGIVTLNFTMTASLYISVLDCPRSILPYSFIGYSNLMTLSFKKRTSMSLADNLSCMNL